MYYIGLDVHKKTISYCVKDASGQVHAAGELGVDPAVPENRIRPAEIVAARSVAGGAAPATQNRSRIGAHHGAELGARERRCVALPVGEARDQLLRAVWGGKELRRQGDADTAFQAAQQTSTTGAGGGGESGTT